MKTETMIKEREILEFPDGKKKAVTLSYDDNVRQDKKFMGICDHYGLKCTFNLNSGLFLPKWLKIPGVYQMLSKKEAKEIFTSGKHELATHGYRHPDYTKLTLEKARKNVKKDKEELERLFGRKFIGHAYPMGTFHEDLKNILKENGILYARTTNSTFGFEIPKDWYEWNPTCYHKDKQVMDCVERFLADDSDRGKLFYLWGHTFEFDADKNWELIEEIAAKLGNRDDVWYCTNGEFYRWVNRFDKVDRRVRNVENI